MSKTDFKDYKKVKREKRLLLRQVRQLEDTIKNLETKVEDLERTNQRQSETIYEISDFEPLGMAIGSAMKEDIRRERELEGWD